MRTMLTIKEATKRTRTFQTKVLQQRLVRKNSFFKKDSTAMVYEVQEGLSKDPYLLKFKMILFFSETYQRQHVTSMMRIQNKSKSKLYIL